DAAKTTGLRPAARAQKVEVLETDFFQKRDDGYIPRIGYLPGATGFAFREKEGGLSEILENESGFYLLRVAGRKPEGIQALSEVKEQIKTTLTANKRKERAKKQAEAFMARLSGKTFDHLASADTALVKTAGPFARQGFIPGIGQDPAFPGATFRLTKPGQLSGLVEGERGYYLIQMVERQPIDETKFASEKGTLRQQLLQQKQTQLYTDWYENIKSQAKIEDRLSEFFVY
ncbi:MAG: peptidylprolyl isomerase, partial [Candidatus Latescibacteria bacterium]|nr:peptidylprolyl isomerase [Candidatus Latescibacterota bacterium]